MLFRVSNKTAIYSICVWCHTKFILGGIVIMRRKSEELSGQAKVLATTSTGVYIESDRFTLGVFSEDSEGMECKVLASCSDHDMAYMAGALLEKLAENIGESIFSTAAHVIGDFCEERAKKDAMGDLLKGVMDREG